MNIKIIEQMQEIVNLVLEDFKKDFQYDIDDLKDFKGCFFWSPRKSGTHLLTVGMDEATLNWLYKNELQKYIFGHKHPVDIMRGQILDLHNPMIAKSQHLYFFDGVGLNKVDIDTAIRLLNTAIVNQLQAAIDLQKVGI